jgi:hypothetical protein
MSVVDDTTNLELLEDIKPSQTQNDDILVDAAGTIPRLLVPSNDVNDPLNFTVWENFTV